MATRIFADRCEDCYDKRKLQTYEVTVDSNRLTVELCVDCIKLRQHIDSTGAKQPPIGLLLPGTWKDADPITFHIGDEEYVIDIKYLTDSECAGLARLKFKNQDVWLTAGAFCYSPRYAQSNTRHFLEHFYFPNQKIRFKP